MSKIQAIRGMNDILPAQTPSWQYLERTFRNVVHRYGYQEIRFPVLEQTQLFKRSIGEVTDIVEKEMYSFDDRNGDNLSLRPEGTAGCVRAAEEHGLLYNQQQRLWYQGPMFRHERPQKGRYRQFEQFGIEAFGMAGPDIDAEVILLSARLWQALDIHQHVVLELNNIGSAEDRRRFGEALTTFLAAHASELDGDSQRRLQSNPLRILDSKVPSTQALLTGAPLLADFVNEESQAHYSELKRLLDETGVAYVENPRLVRGLDYYNNAVFEWTTSELGSQGTVCAGGRYDGLAGQLGGRATPAVGFASGKERLVLLLESLAKIPPSARAGVDICLLIVGDALQSRGLRLAEKIRSQFPDLALQVNCGGGKYNSQMKRAFSSGARVAIVLQADTNGVPEALKLRHLDEEGATVEVTIESLQQQLAALFPA